MKCENSNSMRLIIDKGNTRTKVAVYKKEELLSVTAVDYLEIEFIRELLSKYDIKHTIFSTVAGEEKVEIMQYLAEKTTLLTMSEDLLLPIKINYSPKHTLGKDRIAAIVGGYNMFPEKSVLVIDAGSCICIDFINSQAIYKGGSISLGFQMKSKALNTFTANLPLVNIGNDKVPLCSTNTIDCIKSGIINGTIAEIKGMIDSYSKEEESGFKIILTGGDASFISENLKEEVVVEHNLVLHGLNMILDYNIKKRDV